MADARERPIIFSAPMVRAILDGRKTQTRRILKPQPPEWTANVIDISKPCFDDEMGAWGQVEIIWSRPSLDMPFGEPQREEWRPLKGLSWRPGDRAWVRETWRSEEGGPIRDAAGGQMDFVEPALVYAADGGCGRWRSPIHMPRWASRITLEITDVRVQRLQDISEEDARAEGVADGGCLSCGQPEPCGCANPKPDARDSFANLWASIHGFDAWFDNPWVVALSFRRALAADLEGTDAGTD